MSKPLDAVLALAVDGSPITCTLSPESVQVIFFALSFIEDLKAWQEDYFDQVSEAEAKDIRDLIDQVTQDILP